MLQRLKFLFCVLCTVVHFGVASSALGSGPNGVIQMQTLRSIQDSVSHVLQKLKIMETDIKNVKTTIGTIERTSVDTNQLMKVLVNKKVKTLETAQRETIKQIKTVESKLLSHLVTELDNGHRDVKVLQTEKIYDDVLAREKDDANQSTQIIPNESIVLEMVQKDSRPHPSKRQVRSDNFARGCGLTNAKPVETALRDDTRRLSELITELRTLTSEISRRPHPISSESKKIIEIDDERQLNRPGQEVIEKKQQISHQEAIEREHQAMIALLKQTPSKKVH